MKEILKTLYKYEVLTESEAYDTLSHIASGNCLESQMACFVSAYVMRKPSIAELRGFRNAMMDLCKPVNLSPPDAVDIVGTGGDEKNSFNISTIAAIVVAAAGCKVVKHGSHGATSISGSSNILEYLGYRFVDNQDVLQHQLDTAGICFLHAPLFHPAMKNVSSIRKEIGVRTFFNLLGPLINPAQPAKQVLGVNSLETARTYNYLLQEDGRAYTIIHSIDGYDEISLTSPFKLITATSEQVLYPEELGFESVRPEDILAGSSIKDAADIFLNILKGTGTTAQNNVVIINSAVAIQCVKPHQPIALCIDQAREALVSGKAYSIFKQLTK